MSAFLCLLVLSLVPVSSVVGRFCFVRVASQKNNFIMRDLVPSPPPSPTPGDIAIYSNAEGEIVAFFEEDAVEYAGGGSSS